MTTTTAKVRGTVSGYASGKAAEAKRAETMARLHATALSCPPWWARGILMALWRPRSSAITEARHSAEAAHAEAGRLGAGVRAEQAVVDRLAAMPEVDAVLCGLDLGPPIGDIDVVAIANRRALIVEVKAGGGELVAGADGAVTHGGRPSPGAPLAQVARQASALLDGGVAATAVVCYPGAAPSGVCTPSGVYLIGGLDMLVDLVARHAWHPGTVTVRQVTDAANVSVDLRRGELSRQNTAAGAKVDGWQATVRRAQREHWSREKEIVAGLTQKIADVEARVAVRREQIEKLEESKKANRGLA